MHGVVNTLLKDSKNESLYKLYNIRNSRPVKLFYFIEAIEQEPKTIATKEMLPMQAGDLDQTWADVSHLQQDYNYKSTKTIKVGVHCFIKWYKNYYKIK